MKFLTGQTNSVSKDGIELEIKVIDTATQARVIDMCRDNSFSGRITRVRYMLMSVIASVKIDGINYEPEQIVESADISHKGTLQTIMKIDDLAVDACLPSRPLEKTSG